MGPNLARGDKFRHCRCECADLRVKLSRLVYPSAASAPYIQLQLLSTSMDPLTPHHVQCSGVAELQFEGHSPLWPVTTFESLILLLTLLLVTSTRHRGS